MAYFEDKFTTFHMSGHYLYTLITFKKTMF